MRTALNSYLQMTLRQGALGRGREGLKFVKCQLQPCEWESLWRVGKRIGSQPGYPKPTSPGNVCARQPAAGSQRQGAHSDPGTGSRRLLGLPQAWDKPAARAGQETKLNLGETEGPPRSG